LFVEDDYPVRLIAEGSGISEYSVYRWGKRNRQYGRQGLVDQPRNRPGCKLPAAATQSIIDLKKENPARGARHIADILKRFFMVGASPTTVQRTLKSQGLTAPVKKKRKKNSAKPRFFEMLEPCAVKVARTVLRGLGADNSPRLPDSLFLILGDSAFTGFRIHP
jgi:transposase